MRSLTRILLLIFFFRFTTEIQAKSIEFIIEKGFAFQQWNSSSNVEEFTVRNQLGCALACFQSESCRTVTYFSLLNICQISSQSIIDGRIYSDTNAEILFWIHNSFARKLLLFYSLIKIMFIRTFR